jgi:hypothetical protein
VIHAKAYRLHMDAFRRDSIAPAAGAALRERGRRLDAVRPPASAREIIAATKLPTDFVDSGELRLV